MPSEQLQFGRRVAVCGDIAVVGAHGQGEWSGAIHVFERKAWDWIWQAQLTPSEPDPHDTFGIRVAISGDTVVVGAPQEGGGSRGINGDETDNGLATSGAAYVFSRNGNGWGQQAYLKAHQPDGGDRFGSAVAISGDTIVVGAEYEDSAATRVDGDATDDSMSGAGAVYVFVRTGETWIQQAYVKASNPDPGDRFGRVVAISDDTLVVGAAMEDSAATSVGGDQLDDSAFDAGAAYVFVREEGSWSQRAYLKDPHSRRDQRFGDCVEVSGDMILVGVRWDSSAASGINGDGNDSSLRWSGAAHVFVPAGDTWEHEAYLKASNPQEYASFGHTASISGNRVLISAASEGSAATGVNGTGADVAGPRNVGAAYLFERGEEGWGQVALIKADDPTHVSDFGSSVAMCGSTILIGSRFESSDAAGVNGTRSGSEVYRCGAAFLFDGPTPVRPLTAIERGAADDEVRLVMPPAHGHTIGVEYSSDLSAGTWMDLGDMTQSPGRGTFVDCDPSHTELPTGYYRIFEREAP